MTGDVAGVVVGNLAAAVRRDRALRLSPPAGRGSGRIAATAGIGRGEGQPLARTCARPLESTSDAGFTLIETLVALLLLAVVLAMTPPAFELARRIAGVGPQLERAATIATAQETLARQLSAALPLKSADDAGRLLTPIQGRAERLAFVAPPPLSAPAAGLRRYEIKLAPGARAGQTDFVLQSTPFVPPTAQRFEPPPMETTVLVERAGGLVFRYFGPPLPPKTSGDVWHSDWDRPTLPTLVEIVFETAGPSGRTERHVLLVELKVARTR